MFVTVLMRLCSFFNRRIINFLDDDDKVIPKKCSVPVLKHGRPIINLGVQDACNVTLHASNSHIQRTL